MPKKEISSAHCSHTRQWVVIRQAPARRHVPPEMDCITVMFRCKECMSERELIANHVKLIEAESTCVASVTDDSGWRIPVRGGAPVQP